MYGKAVRLRVLEALGAVGDEPGGVSIVAAAVIVESWVEEWDEVENLKIPELVTRWRCPGNRRCQWCRPGWWCGSPGVAGGTKVGTGASRP